MYVCTHIFAGARLLCRVPDSNDIDTFRQAIELLPGTESPEIFGLHSNADVTFRTLQVCAYNRLCVHTTGCVCIQQAVCTGAPEGFAPGRASFVRSPGLAPGLAAGMRLRVQASPEVQCVG